MPSSLPFLYCLLGRWKTANGYTSIVLTPFYGISIHTTGFSERRIFSFQKEDIDAVALKGKEFPRSKNPGSDSK
jgi:hypothetical protein